MKITLLLPTWSKVSTAGASGVLARWVARGDRVDAAKPGREAQLRAHFEFHGPALPIAALTRSIDANDADSALWLRCDPAYVVADAVTLRLVACGNLQLSSDEVEEFARALKPLFGDAGFPLEAARSDRWYLRCPREAKLPTFSDPADALGDDLARHLPEGDSARQWRSLLNEAQIVLTQHPLNAQRARRGLPPVNSVWFWGAGMLPQWVRCGFSEIYTNDEVAKALARLARAPQRTNSAPSPQPSPPTINPLGERGWNALFPSPSPQLGERVQGEKGSSRLLDLADYRDAASLEADWLVPLGALLAKRKLDAVHLHFLDGERVTYRPANRWRFWRRVKP